jgi:CO/xanthine dehydrogenase Mo-binding subunit
VSGPFIRPDGHEKVAGLGQYTADLVMPGMLHAKFRYADHTHARILRVDTAKARALPGVVAVLTHQEVPGVRYGRQVQDRWLFAKEKVRFEGDIVAAVAATTPEIAAQAATLIEIDYEPLPVLSDYWRALAPDAPLIHEDWAGYEGNADMGREGNLLARATVARGDVRAAFEAADAVIGSRFVTDSSQAVAIEPRALIARWTGDRVTVWSSTQVPFHARAGVAHVLQMPQSKVRIIVPMLGGGFGAKCDFHYEAHVAVLARATNRPVRLVFSRREEFFAIDHRREGMVVELESAARSDGTILARRGRLIIDGGAYCGEGAFMAQLAAINVCGPYRLDAIDIRSDLVYSNNQPSGSVRAPTAPQACWALEQHLDEVAAAIDVDPVELRRRNLIGAGDKGPAGQVFDQLPIRESLEQAAEMIEYGRPLPDDEAIGVACGWWPSYAAPSGAWVKLNNDGTGTIVTGATEAGTGSVMGLPVLVAEVLGMSPQDFGIVYQDTDAGPWDKGAEGSQTTFNNGRAVVEAAGDLRRQLLDLAARAMEVDPADLELAGGRVQVKGAPARHRTIAELASSGAVIGRGTGDVPQAPEAPEAAGCTGRFGFESFLAPQVMTHAVRVKVDRETGVVRVLQVAAVHDSGVIVNRTGADGQVHGGVVMGLGLALTEGTQLTDDGRHRNPGLLDYKLLTASDAPRIDHAWIETETPNAGPKGSKGVGEAPCVPTAAAVGNAIAKVLRTPVRCLPMTPERVWAVAHTEVRA